MYVCVRTDAYMLITFLGVSSLLTVSSGPELSDLDGKCPYRAILPALTPFKYQTSPLVWNKEPSELTSVLLLDCFSELLSKLVKMDSVCRTV